MENKEKDKGLKTKEALKYLRDRGVSVSEMTLLNWYRKYGIAKKIGGTWFADIDLLDKLLSGEISKPISNRISENNNG